MTATTRWRELLGYWSHIARSARLSVAIYTEDHGLSADRRQMLITTCLREFARAEGEVAVLEEYGVEQWRATNTTSEMAQRHAA